MRRRDFAAAFAIACTGAFEIRAAAQADRSYRLGFLINRSLDSEQAHAFSDELRRRGYVEGRNLTVDRRTADMAERDAPLARALAAELVALRPDILVAAGSQQVEALMQATSTIPIVLAGVSDPVGLGLVKSLARPGGNVTGIATYNPELVPKRIELIRDILGGGDRARRLAVLYNPDNSAPRASFREAEQIVATMPGLILLPVPVRLPGELDAVFERILQLRPDALLVIPDVLVAGLDPQIIRFTIENRLPAIFNFPYQAAAGALIAYGSDPRDTYRRAAAFVDRILKGANPAELPVEQPTAFPLVVNLKTAKAIGLTIPTSILLRADEVIE